MPCEILLEKLDFNSMPPRKGYVKVHKVLRYPRAPRQERSNQ